MERARKRKTFYPRITPVNRFDEGKFIKRYRLDKETVTNMARRYEDSGYCSTAGDTRGGGISAVDRVSSRQL